MKILFVIDTYDSHNNGTSISAQRFAAALRTRGHEVKILTQTDELTPDKFALREYQVPFFNGLIHKYGFQFADIDRATISEAVAWADIVHCYMPFALTYYTKKECNRQNKPTTSAFHIQPENITSAIRLGKVKRVTDLVYKMFHHYIYKKFKRIHVPSSFMGRQLEKHGYRAEIYPISNGILPDFVYTKREKEKEYQDKILIMMVGRLAREKRQDVIINAVKHSKYADKIQLIFAGHGPLENDYKKLGKKLKNAPQFIYVGTRELINLLAQCDLYVHASDMESEAISCIEAFGTGLVPIIANSDNSATPQFALDERSLFEPGNPENLANKIDYWLDHYDEKIHMEYQYAEHAKKYTLHNSIVQFEQMLNDEYNEHKAAL